MKRIMLLATTMLFAVLVVGGVAYALNFTCDTELDADPDPGECTGTPKQDFISGTNNGGFINARAGDDIVFARGGANTIEGRSGADRLEGADGQDTLIGNGGPDQLRGFNGTNTYFGGPGNDSINAAFALEPARDEVYGGGGNDIVAANDAEPDTIDCGGGRDDRVATNLVPANDTIAANCESIFRIL
jgi:Ca2+-binding RTX toxin-like protein